MDISISLVATFDEYHCLCGLILLEHSESHIVPKLKPWSDKGGLFRSS